MNLFRGRVATKEIEKKPLELKGDEKEPWVQELLQKSAPQKELTGLEAKDWAEKAKLDTELRVEKVGSDYMVSGRFKADVPSPCSRCGDLFTVGRGGDFRLFLSPTDPRHPPTKAEMSDDPDFILLDSNEIDLQELIAEQLVVQEPVAECPTRKEDGTCTLCGKNPSFAGSPTGQAGVIEATSPFAKLKVLKE